MIRRAYITAIMALGLMVLAVRITPAYSRVVSSTRTFQHYLQDLKGNSNTLSPVERFMFSLILTNAAPERRT